MESCSIHAVIRKNNDDNAEIIGYKNSEGSETLKLHPAFKSNLLRKNLEILLIRQKRSQIRKVVRKTCLDFYIKDDKSLADNIFISIGIRKETYHNKNLQIKYDMNYTPEKEELEKIISQASNENLSNDNDYGFMFVGEEDVQWLGRSIVKIDEEVDVLRINEGIVDLKSLMESLSSKREKIINIISKI